MHKTLHLKRRISFQYNLTEKLGFFTTKENRRCFVANLRRTCTHRGYDGKVDPLGSRYWRIGNGNV